MIIIFTLLLGMMLVMRVHNARLASTKYGAYLDTNLGKLPPSRHLPFLRYQLHNCATVDLHSHTVDTQKRFQSVCSRIQRALSKGLTDDDCDDDDWQDFADITKQVKNCGLAVFLTIVYESDRPKFLESKAVRWFGLDSVDLIVLALLREGKWENVNFIQLPEIDILDAVLLKGDYMFVEEEIMQKLYKIYMHRIVNLMVLFNGDSESISGPEIHASCKTIVSGNIDCAKRYLLQAFHNCLYRQEQADRDLIISIYPTGHFGLLSDMYEQNLHIYSHHLRKLKFADLITLCKHCKEPADRKRLQELYGAALGFIEDQGKT